jgi:hypothetical protein
MSAHSIEVIVLLLRFDETRLLHETWFDIDPLAPVGRRGAHPELRGNSTMLAEGVVRACPAERRNEITSEWDSGGHRCCGRTPG